MGKLIVSHVKLVALGLATFLVCACARMGHVGAAGMAEPRLGDPPSGQTRPAPAEIAEGPAETIDLLELQLAALDRNIANLRKALKEMGPLPDQKIWFIADDPPSPGSIEPEDATGQLYAIAPDLVGGDSLFFETQLAAYPTMAEAQAAWREASEAIRQAGLSPHYRSIDSVISLTVGPLPSEAAVDALCVDLSSLAGPCGVVAPVRAYR